MTPLKSIIVGTGVIAPFHVAALRQQAVPIDVVAAVDVDEQRRSSFAAEHGIDRHFGDLEEALAACQPDFVHLCTPPFTHTPHVLASLEAGAWVLCEKPLCGSLADLDAIEAAETAAEGWCVSICQWRFGSAAEHLRALVKQNLLGRLLTGLCHTMFYRDQAYYDVGWRGRWETELGGATTTNGIHAIDLLLSLHSDWQEVSAMTGTLNHAIEVEDVGMGMVRFDSGAIVSLGASTVSPRQETTIRLDYEDATVEVAGLYGYDNDDWKFTPAPDRADRNLWDIPGQDGGTHAAQIAAVLAARAAGRRPEASSADLRPTLELLTAFYKAAATGMPVRRGAIGTDDPFYQGVAEGMRELAARLHP
uniref:Gfo/Idh/MocA family protein n=1 Tax=Nonomuraea bangladeshensis TaxID=404385 RepID=UPI003F492D90